MKTLTEGHVYALTNFENPDSFQQLNFINKTPKLLTGDIPDPIGEMITIHDGTTNEEVLAVLIDRLQFLQAKFPCRENAIVITKLEESLMWLNKRTEDRKKRNVEGKHLK